MSIYHHAKTLRLCSCLHSVLASELHRAVLMAAPSLSAQFCNQAGHAAVLPHLKAVQLCNVMTSHAPILVSMVFPSLSDHAASFLLQEFFANWGDEGVVDLKEQLSDLIILTASRTLMGTAI